MRKTKMMNEIVSRSSFVFMIEFLCSTCFFCLFLMILVGIWPLVVRVLSDIPLVLHHFVCCTCLLANTRNSSTITDQGFRKMGEVSVAENGLAPVYIMVSHTPALSRSSFLLLLPSTLGEDYGEATLSILVVFFILLFNTIALVPDSPPNHTHPANLDRHRAARAVTSCRFHHVGRGLSPRRGTSWVVAATPVSLPRFLREVV